MLIKGILVAFETTDDDKDKKDAVSIIAMSGNILLGQLTGIGYNNKWENKSNEGPFGVPFGQTIESSEVTVTLAKDGEDGWVFNPRVWGIDANGAQTGLLVLLQGVRFKDEVESTRFVLPSSLREQDMRLPLYDAPAPLMDSKKKQIRK